MARPPARPGLAGRLRPGAVGGGAAGAERESLAVEAEHLARPGGGRHFPGGGQAGGHAGLVGGVEPPADPGAAVAVDRTRPAPLSRQSTATSDRLADRSIRAR